MKLTEEKLKELVVEVMKESKHPKIFLGDQELTGLRPFKGGAYSWILQGPDGLIYAMTIIRTPPLETSKPWLAAYYDQASPKPKHLPAIEYLGVADYDGDKYYLTRMPFYESNPPANCKGIEKAIEAFRDDPFSEKYYLDLVPDTCRDQIVELLKEMDDFEGFMANHGDEGLYRDWNMSNLGWDQNGNIVLFDGYNTEEPYKES